MWNFRIPVLGPASATSGRGRAGLARRLQLAFVSFAALVVLGAVATLLLFGRIEGLVRAMTGEQVPKALQMLEIRDAVDVLAGKAAEVQAARDDARLARVREAVAEVEQRVAEDLAAATAEVRGGLGPEIRRLEQSLDRLVAERAELNAELASLRGEMERLGGAYEQALKAALAPIDDLSFDLVLGMEGLSETATEGGLVEREVRRLLDEGWTPLQSLFVLRAEINRIGGLLSQAAMADDISMLQPLNERFTASVGAARKALGELPPGLQKSAAAALQRLIAFGEGDDGIFARRRRVLENERQLAEVAAEAEAAAQAVAGLAMKRVAAARSAVTAGSQEIHDMLARGRWALVAAALLALLAAASVSVLYLQRRVVRRLNRLHDATLAVAEGRRDVDIPTEGDDELASMGRALALFRDKSAELERLEAERRALAAKAEEEKRAAQRELAQRLEAEIGAIADHFAGAAAALSAAARDLASDAHDEEHAGKIDLVARTCRELEQAAREIAQQMERARAIGDAATENSSRSTRAVEGLDAAIGEIEEVVTLISDIAEQTNLLALNATIEAARAGESGRGFAVVAGEVKALATQTAEATGRIAERIAGIRRSSRETVDTITTTASTVKELADVAGAVAAALEEQSAAIQGILDNVEVASGCALEMRNAASGVAGEAERLRGQVREFVEAIRSA